MLYSIEYNIYTDFSLILKIEISFLKELIQKIVVAFSVFSLFE